MKTFYCCLLLLLATGAAAQKRQPARIKYPPHQTAVSINPLALLNPDLRLMAGVEQRFQKRWSWLADAAVVPLSAYIDEAESALGFELRPALRYYYGKGMEGYLQGQLQYRMVRYKIHDWLGRDCVDGVPSYEQLQDFKYRKQTFGAALVGGGVERLGPRFLLDVSVGLGLMQRYEKVAGGQNCCYNSTDIFGNQRSNNPDWVPIMPISVKLLYVVR